MITTIEQFSIENFKYNLDKIERDSNVFSDSKKEKIALMINLFRNIIESDAVAYKSMNDANSSISTRAVHYEAIRIYKLDLIKAIAEL